MSSAKCCQNWSKCSLKLFQVKISDQNHPNFDMPQTTDLYHSHYHSRITDSQRKMLQYTLPYTVYAWKFIQISLMLNWSIPWHKNILLTSILQARHCKVFAIFNLQTLYLKTSRYQIHWAGVNEIFKYSHAKLSINTEQIFYF